MTKEEMKKKLLTMRKDGKYLDIENLATILSEMQNEIDNLKK